MSDGVGEGMPDGVGEGYTTGAVAVSMVPHPTHKHEGDGSWCTRAPMGEVCGGHGERNGDGGRQSADDGDVDAKEHELYENV